MEPNNTNNKWYDNKAVVVILMILFFPVGLYALWKSNTISKNWKIGVSAVFGFLFIIAIATDDKSDSKTAKKVEKKEKKEIVEEKQKEEPKPVRLTDEEYLKNYSAQFDSIKIVKRFEQAPLYGKYADQLNLVLLDMEKQDSLFQIFSNTKIKTLFDKKYKVWEQAISDYLKFGEPDPDFIYINAACKTALRSYLNDPKFEVVRDKYYLKQTKTGYDYKLQIRGKNKFGALILKEITFSLVYNPFDKMYSVTKIRE